MNRLMLLNVYTLYYTPITLIINMDFFPYSRYNNTKGNRITFEMSIKNVTSCFLNVFNECLIQNINKNVQH